MDPAGFCQIGDLEDVLPFDSLILRVNTTDTNLGWVFLIYDPNEPQWTVNLKGLRQMLAAT